eukprot:1117643-Alexandrium_andersonii.AAC.1
MGKFRELSRSQSKLGIGLTGIAALKSILIVGCGQLWLSELFGTLRTLLLLRSPMAMLWGCA